MNPDPPRSSARSSHEAWPLPLEHQYDIHHTEVPLTAEDTRLGDHLAWFMGDLFLDSMKDAPNYQWSVVARALRFYGLRIVTALDSSSSVEQATPDAVEQLIVNWRECAENILQATKRPPDAVATRLLRCANELKAALPSSRGTPQEGRQTPRLDSLFVVVERHIDEAREAQDFDLQGRWMMFRNGIVACLAQLNMDESLPSPPVPGEGETP